MSGRTKQYPIAIGLVLLLTAGLIAGCARATTPTTTAAPALAVTFTTATAQPAAKAEATVAEATAESTASSETSASTGDTTQDDVYADVLTLDNSAWHYDADNDVYWQIGVQYRATPEATDYETLGILVPGAYMTATANGDGTYTATVDGTGSIDGSSAKAAPMVFPVNASGYSAQPAPTAYSYEEASGHPEAGFIYVAAGIAEETMAMTPVASG
jgi:hypothetical protein